MWFCPVSPRGWPYYACGIVEERPREFGLFHGYSPPAPHDGTVTEKFTVRSSM